MRFVFALLALLVALPVFAADTRLADPKPGWDNPRRIVLQMTTDDAKRVNGILNNAVNLQKFYGTDNVKVAVVAFSAGVRPLLKQDSPVAERVASLLQYDVEFIACGNTLATWEKTEADVLPGVTVTTAGIAEIIERQLQGWHVVAP